VRIDGSLATTRNANAQLVGAKKVRTFREHSPESKPNGYWGNAA